jgi:hypothetical protein
VTVFLAGNGNNAKPGAIVAGLETGLHDPYGLAVDSSGTIYVIRYLESLAYSIFREIPSSFAAAVRLPSADSSAFWIASRSVSSSVARPDDCRDKSCAGVYREILAGRSSSPINGELPKATAASIAFESSRTLPGHRYRFIAFTALRSNPRRAGMGLSVALAKSTKWEIKSGRSSSRSRSGATAISSCCNR